VPGRDGVSTGTGLGVAALLVSTVAVVISARGTRRGALLTVVTTLMADWGSPRVAAAKRRVSLAGEFTGGLADLPEPLQDDVVAVMEYLDRVGFLLRWRLVPRGPVRAFLGEPAAYFWRRLAPIVEAERERRPERQYRADFEWLATS
jgi:hypothetical protein